MSSFGKTVTTLAIWIIVASVVMTALLTNSFEVVPITIAAFIAAGISTGFIHNNDNDKQQEAAASRLEQGNYEKLKRGASSNADMKMRMLLEMMDEDERLAFKEALKRKMLGDAGHNARVNADGELNYDADTLAALMDDELDYLKR